MTTSTQRKVVVQKILREGADFSTKSALRLAEQFVPYFRGVTTEDEAIEAMNRMSEALVVQLSAEVAYHKEGLAYLKEAIRDLPPGKRNAVGGKPIRSLISENDARIDFLRHNRSLLSFFETSLNGAHFIGKCFAGWHLGGYPRVELGHKLAAALCVTNVSAAVREMVEAPFDSFLIQLPPGLLVVGQHGEDPQGIDRIFVTKLSERIEWLACSDRVVAFDDRLISDYLGLNERTRDDLIGDESDYIARLSALVAPDERFVTMIERLILGVCLAMADPAHVKVPPSVGSERGGKTNRASLEPVLRTYRLTAPVTHDFRDHVRQYLEGRGKGSAPSVQILVAGHWKPRLALRVGHPVWVQPYWRGPEDAPIALRAHVVTEPGPSLR